MSSDTSHCNVWTSQRLVHHFSPLAPTPPTPPPPTLPSPSQFPHEQSSTLHSLSTNQTQRRRSVVAHWHRYFGSSLANTVPSSSTIALLLFHTTLHLRSQTRVRHSFLLSLLLPLHYCHCRFCIPTPSRHTPWPGRKKNPKFQIVLRQTCGSMNHIEK